MEIDIEWGITSTSTYSKQSTWTEELQKSVSYGISFLAFSASTSVTETISKQISVSMSSSFSISESKTCKAQCPSHNGTWYMYQWIMKVGEIIDTDVVPFYTYSCLYVCPNSKDFVPKCPLDACANTNCTQCDPW